MLKFVNLTCEESELDFLKNCLEKWDNLKANNITTNDIVHTTILYTIFEAIKNRVNTLEQQEIRRKEMYNLMTLEELDE